MSLIPLDFVIALAIRVLVWLTIAAVKVAARLVRSAIADHPGVTFLLTAAAVNEGWIVTEWAPLALLILGVLAVVRFLSEHSPAEIGKTVKKHARHVGEWVEPVTAARERIHQHRLPPPPIPPPPGGEPTEVPA